MAGDPSHPSDVTLDLDEPRARAPEKEEDLAPGTEVREYRVLRKIAQGGFASVYEVRHPVLARRGAAKVLSRRLTRIPTVVARFVREATAVNQIHHPNIVDVFDYGILDDNRPYYLMEYLDGETLSEMLRREGRCAPAKALSILEPVCAALSAAHQAGFVHRDVKGSNVIVASGPGDETIIKLCDFGIAKLLRPEPGEAELTTEGMKLGSPHAMAPEQITGGTVDARTDIYGLGVLLFRMITGHVPFEAPTPFELERLHLQSRPPRPSGLGPVSADLEAVVLKCLEKSPDLRFASVAAFLDALRSAVSAHPPETPAAPRRVVAIAVTVGTPDAGGGGDEDDADLLDEVDRLIEIAEGLLRDAGCVLAGQTNTQVVGAKLLPDDEDAALAERRSGQALALLLQQRLTPEPQARQKIRIGICMHVDQALVEGSGDSLKIVGGDFLRTERWAPAGDHQGACATRVAAVGLDGCSPLPGQHVKLA